MDCDADTAATNSDDGTTPSNGSTLLEEFPNRRRLLLEEFPQQQRQRHYRYQQKQQQQQRMNKGMNRNWSWQSPTDLFRRRQQESLHQAQQQQQQNAVWGESNNNNNASWKQASAAMMSRFREEGMPVDLAAPSLELQFERGAGREGGGQHRRRRNEPPRRQRHPQRGIEKGGGGGGEGVFAVGKEENAPSASRLTMLQRSLSLSYVLRPSSDNSPPSLSRRGNTTRPGSIQDGGDADGGFDAYHSRPQRELTDFEKEARELYNALV